MIKINKIASITFFTLILSFFCYKFCYFIAEKYFFDKFFYRKSASHGYSYNVPFPLNFGDRSSHLSIINSPDKSNVLGATNEDKYYVAIIGDSYVWGQGVKNDQRFSKLLEKKLNKIRPTKIVSVGEMGNDSLKYLERYDQLKALSNFDLYIFSIVSNDAFIYQETSQYNQKSISIINQCLQMYPNQEPIYEIYGYLISLGYDLKNTTPEINEKINKGHNDSWKNPINICIEENISSQLPTQNSIYFITDNYNNDNPNFSIYKSILEKSNKLVIDSNIAKNHKKYEKYFQGNVFQNFAVSLHETHPNALANQMYADVLYNEIISNPKLGFIE